MKFEKDISILIRINSIIFVLLPFTLITGPFLPDLFISILGLSFIYISIKERKFQYYKNFFVYTFALFYFYLLIRGILSDYPFEFLIKYNGPVFYFRYLFFVLCIVFLLENNSKLLNQFTYSLLFVVILSSLDGYFQWIFGFNFFGFTSPSIRVTGVFRDEEILGHFLSHVVPLLISLLAFKYGTNKKQIIYIILLLMFTEIMIFLTNDRAGFLKIFQFTLLLVILSQHFKLYRLISFVISITIIYILINIAPDSMERFNHTINDVSSTTIPYMPWSAAHETHFYVALDMFSKNLFFGQGPQSFRVLCQIIPEYTNACTSHPHNYYVQTLGELGLFGFSILFLTFLIISLKLIKHFLALWFKINEKNLLQDYYLFLLCFIFLIFWPLIPNQSFYNNWLNVMVYLPLGFFLYFRRLKDPLN